MTNRLVSLILYVTPASALSSGVTYSAGAFSTTNDSAMLECFGDAVEDYSSTGSSNLAFPIAEGTAYVDVMASTVSDYAFPISPYPNYLVYTDAGAWSKDFEEVNKDNVDNDNGDLNYFSGHGASGYFTFAGSSGDNKVTASETSWGDQDAEVVVLAASKTLDYAGRSSFVSADKNMGVHWILGMASDMDDTKTAGQIYGWYLRSGYTVHDAWYDATCDAMDSTRSGAAVQFYMTSRFTTDNDTAASFGPDPKASSGTVLMSWTT